MAVSVGYPQSALARANSEIRERTAPGTRHREIARRALKRADELLGDLEELQLRGDTDVPSWCRDSATAVCWASTKAGLRDPRLDSEDGLIKLMDDVYTLEERLMRRLRLRKVTA